MILQLIQSFQQKVPFLEVLGYPSKPNTFGTPRFGGPKDGPSLVQKQNAGGLRRSHNIQRSIQRLSALSCRLLRRDELAYLASSASGLIQVGNCMILQKGPLQSVVFFAFFGGSLWGLERGFRKGFLTSLPGIVDPLFKQVFFCHWTRFEGTVVLSRR